MRRSRAGKAPPRPAVVLLSGGMDSSTCLALAARQGHPIVALTVQYGQRHRRELESARAIGRAYHVLRHEFLTVPLRALAPSALTDPAILVPPGRSRRARIPSTYVPARNTVLLALALALAESCGAGSIWLGINAVDYSGYPDCRPEYLRAFGRLARLATRAGVEEGRTIRLRAPLLHRSKAEIVRLGNRLGVPWELTYSCYRGGVRPCGRCDACRLRAGGFRSAGTPDPTTGPRGRSQARTLPVAARRG